MKQRAWTLARRLALWFALVSAVVFAATGAYLYRSLERQLVERDDVDLIGKIEQIRHQLADLPSIAAVARDHAALLHNVVGHPELFLEVRDAAGSALVSSHPELRLPVPDAALAATEPPATAWVLQWKRGRVIAAWAALAGNEEVLVLVARQGSQRIALLDAYKEGVAKAVIAGALAMALLGYAVARSALRRVRAVAHTAGGITANRLGERLRVSDAPAELAELIQAFNAMLERLDESFKRLAQFSSDMAHDLRTPIANLVSGTEVALSRVRTTEEYETLLASQLEEYERINRMIDGMLFLARADNAQLALQPERLDAASELARISEYFGGLAEEAGVSIQVEAKGDVRADPGMFRRAVSNLVTNALRFAPSGGRIVLLAYAEDEGARVVEVRNQGPPIPADHLPHIFDRFYRGDSSRSDSHSGSGLGLAIVRSIMALHGGEVAVESRPGEDTVFRLTFPALRGWRPLV